MAWETESKYFSGQGVVLLGDRDPVTGRGMGFLPLGNVSDLKLSIKTSVTEHKESQSGSRGVDLRLTTEVNTSVSMKLENYNAANLALSLRGATTKTVGSTVTDEANKFVPGTISPFSRIGVSAVSIQKGATALVLYVPGTASAVTGQWDYKLNTAAGSVMWATVPKTAALVTGDPVVVSYTFAAQSTVEALTTSATEKYLRFEGLNTADENKPVVVEVFRFLTDPLKDLSLISDKIQEFDMEGTVLLDALQSGSKYFRQTVLS